jgi:hypothetical protein
MPNYYGKSPLGMTCPKCGAYGSHAVKKTDPANYHWSNETVAIFKRIAGSDISYRVRTKKCVYCGEEFQSTEIPNHHFTAIVCELLRLMKDFAKAQNVIEDQNDRFQQITDLALATPKT